MEDLPLVVLFLFGHAAPLEDFLDEGMCIKLPHILIYLGLHVHVHVYSICTCTIIIHVCTFTGVCFTYVIP